MTALVNPAGGFREAWARALGAPARASRIRRRATRVPVVILAFGGLSLALAAGPGPRGVSLVNGGFEQGTSGWSLAGEARLDSAAAHGGNACLRLGAGHASQELIGLAPGTEVSCAAWLRVQEVRDTGQPGYAFLAVYQLDEFDETVASQDFARETGTSGWRRCQTTFRVSPGCRTVSVRAGLFRATGMLWVDDVALVPGPVPVDYAGLVAERLAAAAKRGLEVRTPGRVAIYRDDLPAAGAVSSPNTLAAALQGSGWGVAWLDASELADETGLNREVFDVLVLPYGPSFPLAGAENLRRFLRQGGKLLSTGGYAFDCLWERTALGWRRQAPTAAPALDHALWHCEIPAADWRGQGPLTFSGFLKTARVAGPGMAYFAVYQLAADGGLAEWRDLCQVRGTRDWQEIRGAFTVNPKAVSVDLRAGLYRCQGAAAFDDVRVTNGRGAELLRAGFEPAETANPDAPGPRRWEPSDPRRCEIRTRPKHSGERALTVCLEGAPRNEERLNTRDGIPEDGLRVEPDQLGMFDADYRLERARFASGAPGQPYFARGPRLEGPWEGYAASGVAGFDQARWAPLLETYDRFGRRRGAAGAWLRHYAGPYAGSSWAFFGVTNRDLFASGQDALLSGFTNLVGALVEDCYLSSLTPEPACCRQGEAVRLRARLFNGGRRPMDLRLRVAIHEGEPTEDDTFHPVAEGATPARSPAPCHSEELPVRLVPGIGQEVTISWHPRRFRRDFHWVRAWLLAGSREVDRLDSGFVVWDPDTVARGPDLRYRANYLRLGARPLFMFGTDDWSYVFTTERETPLQWLQDMRQRRDYGVQIYENLQTGMPADPARAEDFLRKVDGVVQLAQKYGQVYFPGLLVGYNVAVSDAELARQTDWCRQFARRYARVPGLIYYFNGDLRCELSPAVTPQWNEFLRQQYAGDAALRRAWGEQAPAEALGRIPAEDFNDWGKPWGDARLKDQNRFRAWLIRRWHQALLAGVREHDTRHPATSEFYQLPHQGVDVPAGIDGLDLCNFGYFDRPGVDLRRFPAVSLYNDQRARGKSFGPGEYGVKTHPAWGDGGDYGYHIARTREQATDLFLAVAHYSLGLGASRIHNWCWKDDAHRVFPWGMVYPCDGVPKDLLCVHRNQSLLIRHFAPVWRPSEVAVLTADSHRFGGAKWTVIEGILQGIDLALATHAENLGTLNEDSLEGLSSARVVFYPIPYCPPDETVRRLLEWVRQGGVLYLSGDVSHGPDLRRTRTRRLEELCGVRYVDELYPNLAVQPGGAEAQPCIRVEPAGARVLRATRAGVPVLTERSLGRGRVIYNLDPIEVHPAAERREDDVKLYREVLQAAGIAPIGLKPDDPSVHVFRVPLADGGQVRVLFDTATNAPARAVELTVGAERVSVTLAPHRPALLWLDGHRALRAVECPGECRRNGMPLVRDTTGGILFALDGRDLARSRALVAMPLRPGEMRVNRENAWDGAMIETGDFSQGRWRRLETRPAGSRGRELAIEAAADQALSLLLICDPGAAPRWRGALERALTDPGSL